MEYNPKDIASVATHYFGRMRPTDSALRRLEEKLRYRGDLDKPFACFMAFFKRQQGDRQAGCTNLIISDSLLEEYESYYFSLEERACITTRADFETFEIKMAVEDNPAKVLANPHYALSPLFRYMTGREFGFHKISVDNRGQASDQLAENPFFYKMYKTGFPVNLNDLLPTGGGG